VSLGKGGNTCAEEQNYLEVGDAKVNREIGMHQTDEAVQGRIEGSNGASKERIKLNDEPEL